MRLLVSNWFKFNANKMIELKNSQSIEKEVGMVYVLYIVYPT